MKIEVGETRRRNKDDPLDDNVTFADENTRERRLYEPLYPGTRYNRNYIRCEENEAWPRIFNAFVASLCSAASPLSSRLNILDVNVPLQYVSEKLGSLCHTVPVGCPT